MMTEKLYQGDEKNLMRIFGSIKEDQLNAAIDKISVSSIREPKLSYLYWIALSVLNCSF
jgi:hypothetical protein